MGPCRIQVVIQMFCTMPVVPVLVAKKEQAAEYMVGHEWDTIAFVFGIHGKSSLAIVVVFIMERP